MGAGTGASEAMPEVENRTLIVDVGGIAGNRRKDGQGKLDEVRLWSEIRSRFKVLSNLCCLIVAGVVSEA